MYAKLLKEDEDAIKNNKQKADEEINYKRMLVHNEYHQIRSENPPWWEKDAPTLDDLETEKAIKPSQENKPPKPKPAKKEAKSIKFEETIVHTEKEKKKTSQENSKS
jgi:hypothetical protein